MLAFTDTAMTKEELLARLRAHAAADEIIKGRYWQDGKGCAVGCSIHGSDHAVYEPMFGIPRVLAQLEDLIFETLPNGEAKKWPIQFVEAIAPGADLSLVWAHFAKWMLTDPDHGVIRFAKCDDLKKAIEKVAALYERLIAGDKPSRDEWLSAWDKARAARTAAYAAYAAAAAADAAADAAYAAYAAYAAAAADAAAFAAYAAAAAYAAYAAAAAADADAASNRRRARDATDEARAAFIIAQRDTLLALLRSTEPALTA